MAISLSKNWRDLSGYKKTEKVPLFTAFGIKGATVPTLSPDLTQAYGESNMISTGASNNSLGRGVGAAGSPGLGTGTTPGSGVPSGSGATTGGLTAGAVNGCSAQQNTANKVIVNKVAAGYGWGTGSEWDALNNVVMAESGYCNTVVNSIGATGIGQFLDTTWASTGIARTFDPTLQAKAMMIYIKARYGTPSAAWTFHKANNYY